MKLFTKRLTLPLVLPLVMTLAVATQVAAENAPTRAKNGMVISQSEIASQVGVDVMKDGGNAIDAAVATAFALAVTHPSAGNIGGGGFLVFRPDSGEPITIDFREMSPAKATDTMWLDNGESSDDRHHESHLSVGVPGTVAGMHMAWEEYGSLPWERLLEPAVRLARDGFVVSDGLARSLDSEMRRMGKYPATKAQFTKNGEPFEAGDILEQGDLAETLVRIADRGVRGFYEGKTARLIAEEMAKNGGLITEEGLKAYRAKKRAPIRGTYRGVEIISMPPPSSGGIVLVQRLNILEGYDIAGDEFGSARNLHRMAESMRRAYSDRAHYLGDPDFNPDMPIERLTSKEYAAQLRWTIQLDRASKSTPDSFEWPKESPETTHYSIVDADRNAVSVTYTLESGYGSGIVVAGAGFLLNNQMGDFNGAPDLTDETGLIGTKPNLAAPHKRMLSSMTPTIVAKDGELLMVTGSPGGRTIINTVLQTILNVVDHDMNAQAAVDAGRIHHQWLPDRIRYERQMFSPDTLHILTWLGHNLDERTDQGSAHVIVVDQEDEILEGGIDRRSYNSGAAFY